MSKLMILIRCLFSGNKERDCNKSNNQDFNHLTSASLTPFNKAATFERINQSIDRYESGLVASSDQRRSPLLKMAASLALLFISSGILFYYLNSNRRQPQRLSLNQLSTSKGEVKKIKLSDGSVVCLNSDSKLEYPTVFAPDKRLVHLSGEAYFEVTKAKHRPFIIESNGIRTKVLGTSFNIKAYKNDENFNVCVLTGKVSVDQSDSKKNSATQVLSRAEIVEFNRKKGAFLKKKAANINRTINWINGELHFSDTSLPDFINTLSRKYGVEIAIDPTLKNRRVYADFNEVPIESILKILPVMLSCTVEKKNNSYLLK